MFRLRERRTPPLSWSIPTAAHTCRRALLSLLPGFASRPISICSFSRPVSGMFRFAVYSSEYTAEASGNSIGARITQSSPPSLERGPHGFHIAVADFPAVAVAAVHVECLHHISNCSLEGIRSTGSVSGLPASWRLDTAGSEERFSRFGCYFGCVPFQRLVDREDSSHFRGRCLSFRLSVESVSRHISQPRHRHNLRSPVVTASQKSPSYASILRWQERAEYRIRYICFRMPFRSLPFRP